jgi:hypothetical protein
MGHWTLKLDEEKSKHGSDFTQQNGFGPAFFAPFAQAGEMHSTIMNLPDKTAINMI